jgi:DNA-binding IclR family transcriptional regulator
MWGVLNREVGEVVFTDVADSPHPVRLQIPVGVRRPLYASPTGWVLLAYAERSWREQYLFSMVTTVETSVPITRALLLREFAKVRAEGTLASIDVPVAGLGSVSAPVFDAKGDCVGAVNVAGPSNRFHANVSSLKVAVQQIAGRASAKLSEGSNSARTKVR